MEYQVTLCPSPLDMFWNRIGTVMLSVNKASYWAIAAITVALAAALAGRLKVASKVGEMVRACAP